MMGIWKKVNKDVLYFLLIAGIASVPLMTNYVITGSSLASELSHIEVISRETGKVFPVRIGVWGSMDYGYTAASFQANVCYLLPVFFRLIGMGSGNAYKWAMLLYNLGTVVTAYVCFSKCFETREAGMIAGMLYTWCPYRLSEMYLVGDLGEIAGWMFFPLLILGLKRLYTESGEEDSYGRLWVLLTWGYSLILLTSTVLLFGAVCMTVLLLFCMRKRTLHKTTLTVIGKTVVAVVLINAWFLVPLLLRMREPSAVGVLIPRDVRGKGMYLIQYLTTFSWGGGNVDLTANGLIDAQAMGPGIAVILLGLVLIWMLFTGQCKPDKEFDFTRRMLWVSGIIMFLSANLFPWDIFQDKNMLFSILLALMGTPAKLGIAACVGLIFVAGQTVVWLLDNRTQKERLILMLLVTAISFGTTQFLLGNILFTGQFVRGDEIQAWGALMLPVITQESIVWRLSEVVSAAALCGCITMCIVRRHKT